ncbi:hypothetical protein PPROV_000322700 [Pycnococcus provasolii]|uniref:Uncharacterized protein n=1 Tax=Pycnococcus provasolii TaxID=41880 RepID=A0A830HD93_9CHLO|nr:hypothetical protein PPROV_000322700 [Pycnococcus provasolii]
MSTLLACAFPVSIAELSADDKPTKLKACRAIAQATCTNENDTSYLRGVCAAGLHKPLIANVVEQPDSDHCRWACLAIFYLARDAENRRLLGEAGAVKALVDALNACLSVSCDTLVEPVVMALVNLTCCDVDNSVVVVRQGGVAALLGVIRSGRGKQLCSSSALALSNIANSSEQNRHAVRDVGCTVPVVALLVVAAKINDLELMRNICSLIKVLSRDADAKYEMVAAGAIEALSSTMVRRDAKTGIVELARQTRMVLEPPPEEIEPAATNIQPALQPGLPSAKGMLPPVRTSSKQSSSSSSPPPSSSAAAAAAVSFNAGSNVGTPPSSRGGLFTSIRNFFRNTPQHANPMCDAATAEQSADDDEMSNPFKPSEEEQTEEDELENAIKLSLADAEAAKEAAKEREVEEAKEMERAVKESLEEKENWDAVRNTTNVHEKLPEMMTQADVTSLVFGGLLSTSA